MKCVAYQEMSVKPIWERCKGSKNWQKYVVKVHEKMVDHRNSVACWEVIYFP